MSSISEFTGSKDPSYGFIGLGTMGWEMARNLRRKLPDESALHVCEINQARRDAFIASTAGNVTALSTPKEIGKCSNIIFTMLPRGEHVLEVFTSPDSGLLSQTYQDPRIFIECSTIDVKTCEDVANLVSQNNAGVFLDAPVSGGQRGARAGTLTFMVGGTKSVFELITPVLKLMGNNLFHCGKIGSGLATKQINNYMSAANMIAVCEGMQLGRLYGLDLKTLAGVINTSTGMSRNSREQNPVKGISSQASAANDFEGGFSTELCHGVIMMSLELGKQLQAKSVIGDAVGRFYSDAIQNELCQGLDFRSIYRLFTDNKGEE